MWGLKFLVVVIIKGTINWGIKNYSELSLMHLLWIQNDFKLNWLMFMSLWRTLIAYYAMHVKMKGQGHVHIWGLHEPESATYHGVAIKSIHVLSSFSNRMVIKCWPSIMLCWINCITLGKLIIIRFNTMNWSEFLQLI